MILIFIFICLIRGTFLFGPPGETLHDHPPTVRPFPHAPLLRRGAALLIEQMNAEHGDTVMFLARGCTERAICEAVLGTPEPGALPIVCTTLRGTRFRVFLPLPRSLTLSLIHI